MERLKFICIIALAIFIASCGNKEVVTEPKTDTVYVPIDSIEDVTNINILTLQTQIDYLNATLSDTRDSLRFYQDSVAVVSEDLFVARYKLGRIGEYNRIAAQGNNLKFLRGWINRVLKD